MPMMTMRRYAGEADLVPLADMLNACTEADGAGEWTSADDLRRQFNEPGLDPERDMLLVEDGDHALAGFGELWLRPPARTIDGRLWFKVHPRARGGDVELRLIDWAEERMRELGREHGVPAVIGSRQRMAESGRIAALEQRGFAVARYYLRMEHPLDGPVPEARLPEGFTMRPLAGEDEVPAWIEAFNQAFADHYDHHDVTVEQRRYWMSYPDYCPEYDLVAVAPDGTIAAVCWCAILEEESRRSGRREGWVHILGTRPQYRKMGLGRAMLLAGLRVLQDAGAVKAGLHVDGDSPTGAGRLYERAGFRTAQTLVHYRKEL